MKNLLFPDFYFQNISEIDLENLSKMGFKGIILDLDNTLVGWEKNSLNEREKIWLEKAKKKFKLFIVSNSFFRRKRAKEIGKILDIPVFSSSFKPLPFYFLKAIKKMNLKKEEVIIIGDQIFTDIIGGNLIGIKTIKVDPLSKKEFLTTRIIRIFENYLFKK
jgi:HAD superfamily phosphatase (TIGR01668 family)